MAVASNGQCVRDDVSLGVISVIIYCHGIQPVSRSIMIVCQAEVVNEVTKFSRESQSGKCHHH